MRSCSFLVLLVLGIALGAFPAFAEQGTAPRQVQYDWTGLYVGVHGGPQSFSSQGYGDLFFLDDTTHVSGDGAEVGGQIGFNKQFGRLVVGFEALGSWDSASDSGNCFGSHPDVDEATGFLSLDHHIAKYYCQSDVSWTAQGLAKLGYTFDDGRLLPYALGGFAVSSFQTSFSRYMRDEDPVLTETSHFTYDTGHQNLVGAAYGGGIQYAAGLGVSIGLEYLHTDYGRNDYKGEGQGDASNGMFQFSYDYSASGHNDLHTDEIRAVLNYNFSN